jgi:hypothetical protein
VMGGGGYGVWMAALWRGCDDGRRQSGERVYSWWKMRGGKNSDLKIGHVRLQLECVRTHISVFNCTRAERICVKCALRSNAYVQQCVCVVGRCGRTHSSEFVRNLMSTFERT